MSFRHAHKRLSAEPCPPAVGGVPRGQIAAGLVLLGLIGLGLYFADRTGAVPAAAARFPMVGGR